MTFWSLNIIYNVTHIIKFNLMSIKDIVPIKVCPLDNLRAKHTRRKEARPAELLEAALELFVVRGFAATRVEEVAAKAGVSKGTLFLYFKSKEDLFEAVVRENIGNQISQGFVEFENFEGSARDMLKFAMFSWWERIGNTKASGICKLVMSEASNFPALANFYHETVVKPGRLLIRSILQRGMDRGEFRDLNLDYAVYSVIAPLMFLTMWKHSLGLCSLDAPLNPKEYIDCQADILVSGILVHQEHFVHTH
jgi:TetR/AcrR family transcriptional regulator